MVTKLIRKLITPTLMFAWALYYFIEVSGKKASAGLFVKPVFWVMLLLYVVIVFMDVRDWRDEEKEAAVKQKEETEEEKAARLAKDLKEKEDLKRTLICLASGILYVFLLPYLGFVLDTFLMLGGLFIWLKAPNKVVALLVAAAVTAGMYLLFKVGLKVPLPKGFPGF